MNANNINIKNRLLSTIVLLMLIAGAQTAFSQNFALNFDGNGDFVNFGNPSGLQITGNQTIEMWIYPTALDARRNPVAKAYGGEGTVTLETDGSLSYYYGTGGGNNNPYQGIGSTPIQANTWTHIAIVRDLTTMRLYWYINGNQVVHIPAQFSYAQSSTLPFYIGRGYVSDFKGMIDEVRIWNVARSASEIVAFKSVGLTGSESGLAAYWPFDEGSGTIISDNTSSGNNGTLNGNTGFVASTAPIIPYQPGGEPFEPVPPTGLPYTIVLSNLTINGEDISYGTQIAVFDDELCVGTTFYDGEPNQSLIAWEADPGQNLAGFTAGNPMSFKFHAAWYSEPVNFDADVTIMKGDGNFGYETFSVVNLNAITTLAPEIMLSAELMNFNAVIVNQSISLPLAFENTGTANLFIGSMQNNTTFFTRSATSLLIEPGTRDTLWITFTPLSVTTYSDILTFVTDDPGLPSVTIPLHGTGLPVPTPQITVTPLNLNFGSIAMNTSKTMVINILNSGNGNLLITNVTSSNTAFSVLGNTAFSLGQNENINVAMSFAPVQAGAYTGQLTIQSNAQNITVPLSGIALQGHFSVVSPTGKPYAVIVENVDIDGFSPLTTDEVAVFDGELCVGVGSYAQGGNSLQLSGNGYVINNNSNAFDLQQLTISAWVYSSNFNQNGFVFEKGPVNSQYSLFFEGSNINFRTYHTSGGYDDFYLNWSSIGIQNNKWNHITATYDGVHKRMYVNGQLKAILSYNKTLRTGQVGQIIGAYGGSGSNSYFFNGNIDEVRVWNHARSVFQIQKEMYRQLVGNEPGLVGYWNFNDGNINNLVAGSTPSYLSGNANTQGIQNIEILTKLMITAWEKDLQLGLPGYTSGNPMSFKVWTEVYDNWVEVETIPEYIVGDGNFGFGQLSIVNLEGTSGLQPDIDVAVENIYVGQVTVGSSVQSILQVTNQGNAPLQIYVSDNSDVFSTDIGNTTIAPLSATNIQVTFAPATAGGYAGLLTISANDPDQPTVTVGLEGFALPAGVANIATSVNSLNFGNVINGTSKTVSLFIINTGTSALTVSNITSGNAVFSVSPTAFTLPNTNDIREVFVTFQPGNKGLFSALLTISSNAPQKQISLSGIGFDNHFGITEPTGIPYTIIVQQTNLQGSILPGDELSVFDGGLCVGMVNSFTGSNTQSVRFNGSNAYLQVPNTASLNPAAITVESWVKTTDGGASRSILSKTNGCASSGYLMWLNQNGVGAGKPGFWVGDGPWLDANVTVHDGQWHHIAGTFDGTTARIYVDGVLSNSRVSTENLSSSNALQIGGSTYCGNLLNGNIDEVKIWNYVLTPQQVQQSMNSIPQANSAGLVGYWPFEGDFDDKSLSNHHTQVLGSPVFEIIAPQLLNELEMIIVAWQADPGNNLPGYTPGNPMSFKLWTGINGFPTELTASANYIIGDGTFGFGQFSIVNLDFNLPAINVDPEEIFVALAEPDSTEVTLTIYNTGTGDLRFSLPDPFTNGKFRASYYYSPGTGASPNFGTFMFEIDDEYIDSSWGNGGPGNGVGNDDFQIKWIGKIYAESAGNYQFRSYTDDGLRLYIDGQPVINQWYDMATTNHYGTVSLSQGFHDLEFHYYENGGWADAYLYWTPPGQAEELVPAANQSWMSISPSSGIIAPAQYVEITISFNSTGLIDGLYAADLLIVNNTSTQSPLVVPTLMNVTGTPQISSSLPEVNFGQVVVNSTLEKSLNIMNIGTQALIIQDIFVQDEINSGFTYQLNDKSFPLSIDPGQSIVTVIAFTPLLPGEVNDTLMILSNAGNAETYLIPLSGSGITPPEIFLTETVFELSYVCNDQFTDSLKIFNFGQDTLSVSMSSDQTWLATNPVQAHIAGGDSISVTIHISTLDLFAGVHEAFLSIQSNDPGQPLLEVLCTLTVTGDPAILCNDFLNMGSANIGDTLVGQLTVANSGCDVLEVFSVGIQSQFPVFSVLNPAFEVQPGDAAILQIAFVPLASNQYNAIITINTNDPATPAFDVVVSATGIEPPKLSVIPQNISEILQSGTTGQESFSVKNTGGQVLEFSTVKDPVNPFMLHLDGNGDYINVVHAPALNPTQEITLEAWIYLIDNVNEFIIGKENSTEGKYRLLVNSSSRLEFKLNNLHVITSNTVVVKNQWYHVAATFDGSTMRIFINGVQDVVQTFDPFTIEPNTDNLRIGRSYQFHYFYGRIDEIRIWSIARNQSEIQSAMYQHLLGSEPELLLYFPILNLTGSIVTDASNNPHNGILFGNPVILGATVPFTDYLTISNGNGNLTANQQQNVLLSLGTAGYFARNYQRQLSVSSNAVINPVQQVTLDFTIEGSSNIVPNPAQITFEDTYIGLMDTLELILPNSGAMAAGITEISFSSPVFSAPVPVSKVFPFSQRTLLIVFEPQLVQLYEATLTISTSDGKSQQIEIPLTGLGLSPPVPDFSPVAANFGQVVINNTSVVGITLSNLGNPPLEVYSYSFSDPAYFSSDLAVPFALNFEQQVQFNVSFTPLNYNAISESMVFNTNVGQVSLPLSGTGTPPDHDLAITQIISPQSGCGLSASEIVTVRIRNFGMLPQNNFDVAYSLNNGADVVETVNQTILSGDVLNYIFSQTLDLAVTGGYGLRAFTMLGSDQNKANDTLSVTITNSPSVGMISDMLPPDSTFSVSEPVVFSWNPAANATFYDLYLWRTNQQKPSIPTVSGITATTYTYLDYLNKNYLYKWQIVARNQCSQSLSPIHVFSFNVFSDLMVTSVDAPVTATSGQPVNISWNVKNFGTGGTGIIPWKDDVYLSPSTFFDVNTAVKVASLSNLSALVQGQSYTNTTTITLDPYLNGNHYVFVRTDVNNTIQEVNENNNIQRTENPMLVSLPPYPDLAVGNIQSLGGNIIPGQQLTVGWTVGNTGDASAIGGWSQRVAIVSDAQTYVLGFVQSIESLDPLVELNLSSTFMVPHQLGMDGEVYLQVRITPNPALIEKPNATANNTALSNQGVLLEQRLFLSLPQPTLPENAGSPIQCIVNRSGSRASALSVSFDVSQENRITIPASAIIPANQAGAAFQVAAINNTWIEGNIDVVITASAAGHPDAIANLAVIDDEVPSLNLNLSVGSANEGDTFQLTLTRDVVSANPLNVMLSVSKANQLVLPASMTIPANEASAVMSVEVINNSTPELTEAVAINASAVGFIPATANITILDEDIPQLSLTIIPSVVSEGAGPYASWATLQLNSPVIANLIVVISAETAGQLFFPSSVSFAPGQIQKQFNIGVVDNGILDGDRTVAVTAAVFISSCNCGAPPETGGADTQNINILDNDGLSLSVNSTPFLVPENQTNAGLLTITRNTTGGPPIAVNIQHNGPNEILLPSSAVIPEGATSVNVPFSTLDDGISDGDQVVTISVTSPDFTPGSCWIIVTDKNLPDYVAQELTLSQAEILINDSVGMSIWIANKGFAPAPANAEVRFYRSANNHLDNSDLLIATQNIPAILNLGDSVQIGAFYKPVDVVGNFFIIASVNMNGTITELIGINNTSSAVPFAILPDYTATASVAGDVFNGTAPIIITGTTQTVTRGPVPNKAVDVYVVVNGTRRVLNAVSDQNGTFSLNFIPLNGEGGAYHVGACYPGQNLDVAQDEFTILAARHNASGYIIWNMWLNETRDFTLELMNISPLGLNNLQLEVLSGPPGCIVNFTPLSLLPGNATALLNYSVTATEVTTGTLYEEVKLQLTSAEGTKFRFSAWFFSQATMGNLKLTPASLNKAMVTNAINYAEFEILNNGLAETGQITIQLPQANWLSLASPPTIESLMPGQKAIVTLKLMPGSDLQLNNPISGQIALSGTNSNSVLLPFLFEPVSLETGNLLVDVVDEYTYNTVAAPHLQGATVTLSHPYSGQVIAQGITDENGHFLAEGIYEGTYMLHVQAPQHASYQNIVFIEKGVTRTQLVFIAFQAITYTWQVVPTLIQDQYEIKLITVFETNVPAPVVEMNMPDTLPQLGVGEVFPFLLTLTNRGLITAQDVEITFPDDEEYMFIANVNTLDILPNTSVQIPVLMKRKPDVKLSGRSLNCTDITITKYKFECGPDNQMRVVAAWSIYLGRVCSGPGGPSIPFYWPVFPGGGGVGPGGPGGGSGPGWGPGLGPSTPYQSSNTGCDPCIAEALNCALDCINPIPPVLDCGADVYANGLNWSNGISCFWGLVDTFSGGSFGCAWCIGTTIGCFINQAIGNTKAAAGSRYPAELEQAFEDMEMLDKAFTAIENAAKETCGNDDLVVREFFGSFKDSVAQYIDTETPINLQAQNDLLIYFAGSDITESEILDFITYWNTTLQARALGVYSPSPEFPHIIDTLLLHHYQLQLDTVIQYTKARGYNSIDQLYNQAAEIYAGYLQAKNSAVCATVTVEFSQTLTMTREAFEGTLTIFNGHETDAMENIMLALEIKDEDGAIKNDLFQINTKSLNQISGIDGSGILEALTEGTAVITFIPERGAAPDVPKYYSFGGTLSYLDPFTGEIFEQQLFPVTLQINPSPDLYIDYFMQRDILGDDALTPDIEPMVPAELAVMIDNRGTGTAYSVNIESAQPRIIENEKGLLIDFQIVGSNLSGKPRQLGLLNVDFGDIPGGEIAIGQWWFTSTLLGHFISYEVSINHLNSFGNPDLSLVSSVQVHELIRGVSVYGPPDDSISDFLVNDIPDTHDIPDALYYSNGAIAQVYQATASQTDGQVNMSNLEIQLTVTPFTMGWNYTKLNDPGNGLFRIISCTRQDGQVIPLDNIWLTHVTIPDGGEPVYENKLHFLDYFSSTVPYSYTVVFEPGNLDVPEVVAITGIPAGITDTPVINIEVVFNKPIDPATFDYEDMVLSNQGGPNMMDNSVIVSQVNDTVFNVDISTKTTANGFYALTVQAAGIADLMGNFGQVGKQVTWVQALSTPAIVLFIGLPEDGHPIDSLLVMFNMPINPATFTTAQLVLTGPDGILIPAESLVISDASINNMLFKISGLLPLTSDDGNYQLLFKLTEIQGENGVSGLLDQPAQWTVCQVPPPAANAGENATICSDQTYQLSGLVENADSFAWSTSGTGTFDNNQVLNPVYTPSLADKITGVVHLTLTAQPLHPCAPVATDVMTLYITQTVVNSVSVRASANYICSGTNVVFTATPINGGSQPTYQWKLNGEVVGTNSIIYENSNLSDDDVVQVVMISSLPCPRPEEAISNAITMIVYPLIHPEVTLTATATEIVEGTNVIFTATPTNGGIEPFYQWLLNGNAVGSYYNTFESNTLQHGDQIQVLMDSDLPCAVNPAVSNIIQMTVNPDTTVRCPAVVVTSIYHPPFLLEVSLPEGGTYSGPGVSGNIFNPVTAGLGIHVITYTYINPETNFTKNCNFPLVVNDLPLSVPLQNMLVSHYSDVCFAAMQTISLAGDGTYFIIADNAQAEFTAGKNILLLEGTHVNAGAHAIFRIETGNGFCEPHQTLVLQNHTLTGTVDTCFASQEVISLAGNGTIFIVDNGVIAEFEAGKLISMNDVTHVKAGAYALFRIETGDDFCTNSRSVVAGSDVKPEEKIIGDMNHYPNSAFEPQPFIIYPNPTTGIFNIEFSEPVTDAFIGIYTMLGQKVLIRHSEGSSHIELNLAAQPKGIYIIRVIQGEAHHSKRLIKN